jgi:hypothetical protein
MNGAGDENRTHVSSLGRAASVSGVIQTTESLFLAADVRLSQSTIFFVDF